MVANLATFDDGRVRMASWGRIPVWHRTGQRSDTLMTWDEAKDLGGLVYPVGLRKSLWRDDDGTTYPGHGVEIVRLDTRESLGSATDRYVAIQNEEAFRALIEPLMKSGDLKGIMTCGVLGKGEQAWVQAVLGEFGVDDVDRGVVTLLITNDHQAKKAFQVGFNCVYVVCGNTYGMAESEWARTKNVVSVMHAGNPMAQIERLAQQIDFEQKRVKTHEEIARELVKHPIRAEEVWALALASMPPTDTTVEKWIEQRDEGKERTGYFVNQYRKVMEEYFHGPGMDLTTRRETAFGGWNAITGYVDHKRQENSTPSSRDRMILLGSGRDIKRRALDVAVDRYLNGKPMSDEEKELVSLCPMP